MRRQLRQIKSIIKKDRAYNEYKQVFQHRQMRFLVSKIYLLFSEVPPQQIAKIELQLVQNPTPRAFSAAFQMIASARAWNLFGNFIYLIYKSSSYKYDLARHKPNIFISDPLTANAHKRSYYSKWLQTLDFAKPETNQKVRKVLKLVF